MSKNHPEGDRLLGEISAKAVTVYNTSRLLKNQVVFESFFI